jgi:hypothetical protein
MKPSARSPLPLRSLRYGRFPLNHPQYKERYTTTIIRDFHVTLLPGLKRRSQQIRKHVHECHVNGKKSDFLPVEIVIEIEIGKMYKDAITENKLRHLSLA